MVELHVPIDPVQLVAASGLFDVPGASINSERLNERVHTSTRSRAQHARDLELSTSHTRLRAAPGVPGNAHNLQRPIGARLDVGGQRRQAAG